MNGKKIKKQNETKFRRNWKVLCVYCIYIYIICVICETYALCNEGILLERNIWLFSVIYALNVLLRTTTKLMLLNEKQQQQRNEYNKQPICVWNRGTYLYTTFTIHLINKNKEAKNEKNSYKIHTLHLYILEIWNNINVNLYWFDWNEHINVTMMAVTYECSIE